MEDLPLVCGPVKAKSKALIMDESKHAKDQRILTSPWDMAIIKRPKTPFKSQDDYLPNER